MNFDRSIMHLLPSNIMFDIFSRVPTKCLARSRCVSKVWRKYINDRYLVILHNERAPEEPTPIMYHLHLCSELITCSLCFHVIESKQTQGNVAYVLDAKPGPYLEFTRKKPHYEPSKASLEVRGSCHGLICLSHADEYFGSYLITSLYVIHPLRTECYELPDFPKNMGRVSCGLGFDAFTNTFKMVCVFLKEYTPPNKPDMVRKNICSMVHVLGTRSWRKIPQVPSNLITGKAVFADGCLHWLASHSENKTDGGREVIWFDVNKEEFGVIDPPRRMCDLWRRDSCEYDHVVDLNGEVGYVSNRTMEVWVLKQKHWVPHCRLEIQVVPDGYVEVLGCWNKHGDMFIRKLGNKRYEFFVYNLKSGALHKTTISGIYTEDKLSPNFIMHRNNRSSIEGVRHNGNALFSGSMKRTFQKKGSCRALLSNLPWY